MLTIGLYAHAASAQQAESAAPNAPKSGSPLPSITVQAPKAKPKPKGAQARANNSAAISPQPQATNAVDPSAQGSANTPPLQRTPTVAKTGTPVGEIPASIQVIPAETVREQGGTTLQDSIKNVSGVNVGGPATQNYFDRFSIRGLDARIYNDGFSEGDQINGIPHSLNGVAQIEVLKGPGSALLGSGPGGGSINIVHYEPSSVPHYGVGVQIGDFGTLSTNVYATGPSIVPGVNYRVDALVANMDGFRDLKGSNYEFRPTISWTGDGHVLTVSLDLRHLERTPDPFGIIYNPATGQPFNVSRDNRYYSPFSHADQDLERITVTDAYTVNKYLTINNRFSYTHRDLDILRDGGLGGGDGSGGGNGGAGSIKGTALTGRTIREQTDHIDDVNYAFEPVWKFATGSVRHTLVTGAQAQYVSIDTNRATADLPNIDNIFAPVLKKLRAGPRFQAR